MNLEHMFPISLVPAVLLCREKVTGRDSIIAIIMVVVVVATMGVVAEELVHK
jgi:hypothetical protein